MKELIKLILASSVLCSCAEFMTPSSSVYTPPKMIRNEKCFESTYMQVFQVFDDGILGYICPSGEYFDNCWKGDLIYMPVPAKTNDFVDDQKVILNQDECFESNGTYKYLTKENVKKTVRKIKIIKSQIPNPDYKG